MKNNDILLRNESVRVLVQPWNGGRLRSIQVEGRELLGTSQNTTVPAAMRQGCFPMAPFAGKIEGGVIVSPSNTWAMPCNLTGAAAHGLVMDRAWDVLRFSESEVLLEVVLDERWPPGGRVQVAYRLIECGLRATMTMINEDDEPMPGSLGFHPWFERCCDGVTGQMDLDSANDPGPPRDHVFSDLARAPGMLWPHEQLQLASSAGYWTVYEEGLNLACIEPWTQQPSAVTDGVTSLLAPGQELSLDFSIELVQLSSTAREGPTS